MTTNKPEVKRYELESGHDSMMRRFTRMRESDGGVYVRLDDYETLQAELERERQRRFDGNEMASREHREDVAGLVDALERISSMDSMSYHSLESAKIVARKALTVHRKGAES